MDRVEDCCRLSRFLFHPLHEEGRARKIVAVIVSVALFALSFAIAHTIHYGAHAVRYGYERWKGRTISHVQRKEHVEKEQGEPNNMATSVTTFCPEGYRAKLQERSNEELAAKLDKVSATFSERCNSMEREASQAGGFFRRRSWGPKQEDLEAVKIFFDKIEIVEEVLEGRGKGFFGGRQEWKSTNARISLEQLRSKCGDAFRAVFGDWSLLHDKQLVMSRIGDLPVASSQGLSTLESIMAEDPALRRKLEERTRNGVCKVLDVAERLLLLQKGPLDNDGNPLPRGRLSNESYRITMAWSEKFNEHKVLFFECVRTALYDLGREYWNQKEITSPEDTASGLQLVKEGAEEFLKNRRSIPEEGVEEKERVLQEIEAAIQKMEELITTHGEELTISAVASTASSSSSSSVDGLIEGEGPIPVCRAGYRQYTVKDLFSMSNRDLYKVFCYVVRAIDIEIKQLDLVLNKNRLLDVCDDWTLEMCTASLETLKELLSVMNVVSFFFEHRGVVVFEGSQIAENRRYQIGLFREKVPESTFDGVFESKALLQGRPILTEREECDDVLQSICTTPKQVRSKYIYLRDDGKEIEFFSPDTNLAQTYSFVDMLDATRCYGSIMKGAMYFKDIVVDYIALGKTPDQYKPELAKFYSVEPSRRLDRINEIHIDDIGFYMDQEADKTSMRANCPMKLFDDNLGAFHAPSRRELVENYGVSVEMAFRYDYFMFFHRPVRNEDVDFGDIRNRFAPSGKNFFIRGDKTSKEREQRLEQLYEKSSFGCLLWKEGAEQRMLWAARDADKREQGEIPWNNKYWKSMKPAYDQSKKTRAAIRSSGRAERAIARREFENSMVGRTFDGTVSLLERGWNLVSGALERNLYKKRDEGPADS